MSAERDMLSRRSLLIAAGTVALGGATVAQQETTKPIPKRPPALPPELVREFVGAAHGDLEKTRALLAKESGLLNATWDWGGGDFEMAIGGAGHMGRRDIAEFLLSQGARMDLFVAAMLGKLEIVKATLSAYPELKSSKGPHGITLTRHAEMGGEGAAEVLKYLQAIGAE